MDEILVTYVNHTRGYKARLRIDGGRHDGMKVAAMVARLLFPDADEKAPDPVFDRIMKEREAEHRRRRSARK